MKYALILLQLLPAIIDAIRAIENAIPEGGKGKEKLEAIRETLMIADSSLGDLWPKISAVVGVMVDLFNKVGAFKKPTE